MLKKIVEFYKSIPAATMLIMVFLPFLANFVMSNTELLDNRMLYTRPTQFDRSFSKNYENYYNDTFAYRSKLVKRYVKLQKKLKLDTGKFVFGLGDWMFFDSAKDADADSMADYKGELRFSDAQKETMVKGILKAEKVYSKYGLKYLVVVAPNKENVYSEFMPNNLQRSRVSEVSRIDDAIGYINEHNGSMDDILNLKQSLIEAKKDYPFILYYMTDTHWNKMGAYVGFLEIMKRFEKDGLKLSLKKLEPSMVSQAPARTFDMNPSYKEVDYNVEFLPQIKPQLVAEENDGKRLIYHSDNALTKKKLLMVRDSFALDLIPYLTKVFSDVVCVQQSRGTHEDIEKFIVEYKPDYLIDEVVERKFVKFLDYDGYYQ